MLAGAAHAAAVMGHGLGITWVAALCQLTHSAMVVSLEWPPASLFAQSAPEVGSLWASSHDQQKQAALYCPKLVLAASGFRPGEAVLDICWHPVMHDLGAGSLGWQAYVRFAVWMALCMLLYVLWSIHQPRAGTRSAGYAQPGRDADQERPACLLSIVSLLTSGLITRSVSRRCVLRVACPSTMQMLRVQGMHANAEMCVPR